MLDGVSISGGDPFYNPKELILFLKLLKEKTQKNIWCYTGYRYEQIKENHTMQNALKYIDVLVDGKFEIDKKAPSLFFRGSSNQRLLSLKNGEIAYEILDENLF